MSTQQTNLQVQLTAWFMRRTPSGGVRRVASIAAALGTDVGEIRNENQDRIAIARGRDRQQRPFVVAALADGIGGMRHGSECAALALGSFIGTVAHEAMVSDDPRLWLIRGIDDANNDVHEESHGEGGSTLAAVLFLGDGSIHWTSVGDSRVYVARDPDLLQLSIDDTIAGQLGRAGDVGHEQSKLIQFIGIGEALETTVSDLHRGTDSAVFLTTDGVHFLDSTQWFSQLIKHALDPGTCVRRLIELSRWCGGPDNASTAMISLAGSIDESMPQIEGCIEVWDPFGELQVIVKMPKVSSAPVSPGLQKDPDAILALPSADYSPDRESQRGAESSVSQMKSPSPRKGKSAEKARKAEKAKDNPDAPQLLIEFPNKTS
ncbi:MAG: hypothetical protein KA152_03920 [Verrucomicrobiales bacterium]|nr:hypothetical protein [Verrucomicrobiales bacterium]